MPNEENGKRFRQNPLFSDTEAAEYRVYDLVPGGAARQFAHGVQGFLGVRQHGVRRQARFQRGGGAANGHQPPANGGFLPDVGQKRPGLGGRAGGEAAFYGAYQRLQALRRHGAEGQNGLRRAQPLRAAGQRGGGVQVIFADSQNPVGGLGSKGENVRVNGGEPRSIGPGLVILLGVRDTDTLDIVPKLADKCAGLRIFKDENDKLNLSAKDLGYSALVVSQFTLYGDTKKGYRPSFIKAARAPLAVDAYELFLAEMNRQGLRDVQHGEFGADMQVSLVNEGPCTIVIDTDEWAHHS